jgi:hypothetical protein
MIWNIVFRSIVIFGKFFKGMNKNKFLKYLIYSFIDLINVWQFIVFQKRKTKRFSKFNLNLTCIKKLN